MHSKDAALLCGVFAANKEKSQNLKTISDDFDLEIPVFKNHETEDAK
jgi:hypothetical protein